MTMQSDQNPYQSTRDDGKQATRSVRPRIHPIDIAIIGVIAILGGISAAIGDQFVDLQVSNRDRYMADIRSILILILAPAITFGLVTFWCTIAITRNTSLSVFARIERGVLMNVITIPAAYVVFVGTASVTHSIIGRHMEITIFAVVAIISGLILLCFSVFQRNWLGNVNRQDDRTLGNEETKPACQRTHGW